MILELEHVDFKHLSVLAHFTKHVGSCLVEFRVYALLAWLKRGVLETRLGWGHYHHGLAGPKS